MNRKIYIKIRQLRQLIQTSPKLFPAASISKLMSDSIIIEIVS